MRFFERNAIKLVNSALAQFDRERMSKTVTHLIVASCTGFYAPGLDIDIVRTSTSTPRSSAPRSVSWAVTQA